MVVRVLEALDFVMPIARSILIFKIPRIVFECIDECPHMVCVYKCRDTLESCRYNGTNCEVDNTGCETICNDTFLDDE